jgi:MinD-like ATPase involved in chromosome partitioning or flagellar assembly
MLPRRGRLPILAEISGPGPGSEAARAWSLRRADIASMRSLLDKLGDRRVVLAAGDEALVAAVALAAAAGATGRRTALLECDLASPRLARALGLADAPGLHEYLLWEATAGQILQPLVLAGPAAHGVSDPLICIVAGAKAPNPSAVLNSESFRHAVGKLRRAYDLTILTGPALGPDRWALQSAAEVADTLFACVSPAQSSTKGSRPIRAAIRRLPGAALGAIVVGEG